MDSAATVLMSGSKQNPRDGHRGKFRVWRRTGDLSQWQERFSASGTVDWHSIGWSASMSRDGQQIMTGSWAAYEASVWSGNSDSSSWQVIDTLTRHDCCTGGQFGHGGGMSLRGDGNVGARMRIAKCLGVRVGPELGRIRRAALAWRTITEGGEKRGEVASEEEEDSEGGDSDA